MSKIFGLARKASEYVRSRQSRAVQAADRQIRQQQSSDYVKSRKRILDTLGRFIFSGPSKDRQEKKPSPPGGYDQRSGAPPVSASGFGIPPRPPAAPPTMGGLPDEPDDDRELGYGDIQLLGRDASYDPADWKVVMDSMRPTPGSSNVYGYYYERESRTHGILYVTFLAVADREGRRSGPGPTYGYYGVPAAKYHAFRRNSAASAGNAVWDFLRVRGTVWAHQHNYRLIQPGGEYVPRKATQRGFRTRNVPSPGVGRRSFQRSTLPERLFTAQPDRGGPDRGEPDRGR